MAAIFSNRWKNGAKTVQRYTQSCEYYSTWGSIKYSSVFETHTLMPVQHSHESLVRTTSKADFLAMSSP